MFISSTGVDKKTVEAPPGVADGVAPPGVADGVAPPGVVDGVASDDPLNAVPIRRAYDQSGGGVIYTLGVMFKSPKSCDGFDV